MNEYNGPVTEKEMEEEFERATEQEQQWLTQQETPYADRALDEVPDDEDFDDLALEGAPESDVYPLVGGGYAIVSPREDFGKPLGYILSRQDPYGIYTPDGRKIGSTCGCEDYPCCGH